MGKKKLESATDELQRIAALPYNPFFKEHVEKIRKDYSIPVDFGRGLTWLRHYFDDWLRNDTTKSLLLANIFRHFNIPDHRHAKGANDTEVPLEKDIIFLLKLFRLPTTLTLSVLDHIVMGVTLAPCRREPIVACGLSQPGYGPEAMFIIYNVSFWTTRKQWEEVWNHQVRPWLELLRENLEETKGMKPPSKKRATLKSLDEQMKRWAEWYQLSEREGLGPVKALEQWEKEYPDQSGKFDLSTVTHATQKFKEIITPVKHLNL